MTQRLILIIVLISSVCAAHADTPQGKPISATPPGWYYAERASDKKLVIFNFPGPNDKTVTAPEVYLTEDIPAIPPSALNSPEMSEARKIARKAADRAARKMKNDPLSQINNAIKER